MGVAKPVCCIASPSAHCVLHISLQVPVGAVCVGESPAVNFENSYFCHWQRRPVRTRQLVDERDGWGGVSAVRWGIRVWVRALHPNCSDSSGGRPWPGIIGRK